MKYTSDHFADLYRNVGLGIWTLKLKVDDGAYVYRVLRPTMRKMFEDLYTRMARTHFNLSFRDYSEDKTILSNVKVGVLLVNEAFNYLAVRFKMDDGASLYTVIDEYHSRNLMVLYNDFKTHREASNRNSPYLFDEYILMPN